MARTIYSFVELRASDIGKFFDVTISILVLDVVLSENNADTIVDSMNDVITELVDK